MSNTTSSCIYVWHDYFLQVARNSARITHAHSSAVIGAILQAVAVHTALELRGSGLEPVTFVESLLSVVVPLEGAVEEELTSEVNNIMGPPLQTKR